MSTTYPLWSLTTYPDSLDKGNINIRQDIVNFENRTSSTDPMLYYVLSNDVRSLQQAVFSVQETLGVIPQSTFGTVDSRIGALEDYTDLDARYGGATWNGLAPETRPTILGHLHSGTATGSSKIDLLSHVTGKLSKVNINLTRTDVNGITGEDIALSPATDQTIASKFNDKLEKTGGTIQGVGAYLSVNGSFNSRVYKEEDAYLCSGTTGTNIADTEAFSGTAKRVLSSNAAGNLIHYTSQLRYGDYSLAFRLRVSNIAPLQSIGKVKIYSGTTLTKEVEIIPSIFESTSYQMFYVGFTHEDNINVNVDVYWYGVSIQPPIACDLVIEGITITPLHLTAYDID